MNNLIKKTGADHIILTRIKGGTDVPDHYTKQYNPDGNVPVHILNLRKLSKLIESFEFLPVFQSSWAKDYMSEDGFINVPKDHQYYCTSHMFFSKRTNNFSNGG